MQYPINKSLLELCTTLAKNRLPGEKVYLVGGMVRDILLDQSIHDIDIAYSGDVKSFSKKVADSLDAPFFMLNENFHTARIVNTKENNTWQYMDVIRLQGENIEEDLEKRDFTINAMALDLDSIDQLIDPLRGARDLQNKMIVACSRKSFQNDPIRVMRAIRFSLLLDCQIDKSTLLSLKEAVVLLDEVTVERKRDELMRLLSLDNVSQSIHLMYHTGILEIVLPDLRKIIHAESTNHESANSWQLTFRIVKKASYLENLFFSQTVGEWAKDVQSAQLITLLNHFRDFLKLYFQTHLNSERSLKSLLYLILLFNQYGIDVKSLNPLNDIQKSMDFYNTPFNNLKLSKKEVNLASKTLTYATKIHHLALQKEYLSGKDVFQFFQETGESGIFVCLTTIFENLARIQLSEKVVNFEKEVGFIKTLFEGYFEKKTEWVSPPKYINGNDLVNILGEDDRTQIGYWLQRLSEESADQTIRNRQDALNFMAANYNKNNGN